MIADFCEWLVPPWRSEVSAPPYLSPKTLAFAALRCAVRNEGDGLAVWTTNAGKTTRGAQVRAQHCAGAVWCVPNEKREIPGESWNFLKEVVPTKKKML